MTTPAEPSATTQALLLRAYLAYNAQDADRLLALVSEDVDWPDDIGGRIRGRQALAAYWAEQWQHVRAHDHPVAFRSQDDGRVAVQVEQVVRTLDGTTVSTDRFVHLHRLDRDGTQIVRMDIVPWETAVTESARSGA